MFNPGLFSFKSLEGKTLNSAAIKIKLSEESVCARCTVPILYVFSRLKAEKEERKKEREKKTREVERQGVRK